MEEPQIKLLMKAATLAKHDPSALKPVNPWTQTGVVASSMQIAVEALDPQQAAKWKVEAGQSVSLAASAARVGISEMTAKAHEQLMDLDADYRAGFEEAQARREADALAAMEQGAAQLRDIREKQQAQFQRQSGSNTSMGAHNRDFLKRIGGPQNLSKPARRVMGN